MQPSLRDIVLPQPDIWDNVLQPGYWLVALVIALAAALWWLRKSRAFIRNKRRAEHKLKQLQGIGAGDANILLGELLRHKTAIPNVNHDREQWRRLLLSYSSSQPQLAQVLAFHYRESTPVDEQWLLQELIRYIRELR